MISEITETTDKTGEWVFYDDRCPFCTAWAHRVQRPLGRLGFRFAALQTPWVRQRVGEDWDEVKVMTTDGAVLGGAEAMIHLARRVWWMRPLWVFSRMPGALPLLDCGYRYVAAKRNCLNGACRRSHAPQAIGWLPLVALVLGALTLDARVPAWALMWTMTVAIFGGFKWLTWWRAREEGVSAPIGRSLGYLLLWPGMNARTFLGRSACPPKPTAWQWAFAAGNAAFGALLFWELARLAGVQHPLLTGWIGLVGLAFILHFGMIQLLTLAWRRAGVQAEPLMRAPILSRSLAEFWGERWNSAFAHLARPVWFTPWCDHFGVTRATLGVFLISGLLHELVISQPAGGGYGLPTAYFLLEGLGLYAERRWRIPRNRWGWLWTLALTAGPVFWLFHPLFIRNVVLPFMRAAGAL